MRVAVAAVIALSLPALASAQSSKSSQSGAVTGLGPIGLPLPTIGLPLPSMGLSPVEPDRRTTSKPTRKRAPRHRRPASGVVYVVPYYGYDAPRDPPASATSNAVAPPPAAPSTGRLRLDMQSSPGDLRVFVDGAYIGTTGDVGDELELEAGRHHLELRAEGYEPHAFDVSISDGRTITYRESLTRTAVADPTPEPPPDRNAEPIPPSTIYFIPGCYLGNVHPRELTLPAGCDLKKLVTQKATR